MIKFKHGRDKNKLYSVHPILFMIVADAASWFHMRGHDFIVTETITTLDIDEKIGRQSSSHREGRAIDARANNLPKDLLFRFANEFNKRYKDVAAIGSRNNDPKLIVLHGEGDNFHMHIQIHTRFKLEFKDEKENARFELEFKNEQKIDIAEVHRPSI